MKQMLSAALACAVLSLGVVPAFSAADSGIVVHRCDGTTYDMEGEAAENFRDTARISDTAQVEIWNGCYRVTDVEDGMYVTRFYDPTSRMVLQ